MRQPRRQGLERFPLHAVFRGKLSGYYDTYYAACGPHWQCARAFLRKFMQIPAFAAEIRRPNADN
ncbi:hypothetical protein, partial [Streptococcus pneumoniae]|uniref:hypothetical protein n=1 Tax=Streptococcus pneumoniae TaxID=1313 RepID=UPI001954E17E